jgi:CheY-like chemotaxis protein
MAVIALFSGSYCHGEEVGQALAQKLGYPDIVRQVLAETASRYSLSPDKIQRAIQGPPPLFAGKYHRERMVILSRLKAVLAEFIQPDRVICQGYLSHLISREIAHVLRVLLIANHDWRVNTAMSEAGLSRKEASKRIKKDDEEKAQWTQLLFEKAPWDPSLYDVVLPMHDTSVEEAVRIIAENCAKDAVATTPQSLRAAEDFLLQARIETALGEKNDGLEIRCSDGHVTILINKTILRLDQFQEEIRQIAAAVPGVKEVETKVGPKYNQPSIIRNVDLELPKKILLVDDEVEFVHTLSERLQTRNLESSVVYDGEQALNFVATEEPEVMVLDLKMPGIDGIEVLRRVKHDHPNVEVIILTGHGSEREEALAKELGAFAYLHKPVNIDVLAKTMKEAYRKISEKKASAGGEPEKNSSQL